MSWPALAQTNVNGSPDGPQISAEVFANKGLEHFYSLEFEEARQNYRQALELDPRNPIYLTALADTYLFDLLMAAGRLDSQLYSDSNEFTQVKKVEPSAATTGRMWELLNQARALAGERLQKNQRDAESHYALGLNYAVEAHYHMQVTRHYREALRAGLHAKEHHERVRLLDPSDHDASLLIGVYEYAVGSIPGSVRWIFLLAGYSGSKERGVQLLQEVMVKGRRTSPAALTMLAVIYNRERQYVHNRAMLGHLLRFFPRNYLYEMEIASSFRREGNTEAAVATYLSVAEKVWQGAPGYHRVDTSRLHFQIASLLEQTPRRREALAHYEKALENRAPDDAISAQCYLRMGEIYRSLNNRAKAREMFEKARALPFPEIRRQAEARMRSL